MPPDPNPVALVFGRSARGPDRGGSANGFRGVVACTATALIASFLGMLAVLIGNQISPTGAPLNPEDVVAVVGITLFWAPAIAFVPAAVIGFVVERPKARAMIARQRGGFIAHVAISTLAGAVLAVLFRLGLHLFDPIKGIFDPLVLLFFTLIGFCSGLAWWQIVVVAGRRA